MADKVFGVKADDEVMEKIEGMIESSGLSKKDFFARLIESEEARQTREGLSNRESTETFLHLLKRTEEVFVETSKNFSDKIISYEEKIMGLEGGLQQARSDAHAESTAAKARVKECEDNVISIQDQTNLEIEGYKERAENAEELAKEVRSNAQRMVNELENIRGQVSDLRQDRDTARKEIKTVQNEKKALQNEKNAFQKETEKGKDKISELHKQITESEKAVIIARENGRGEGKNESAAIIEKLQGQIEKMQNQSERSQSDMKKLFEEKDGLWEQLSKCREERARIEKKEEKNPRSEKQEKTDTKGKKK